VPQDIFSTESLTVFLFGNGVPFPMAEQLVRACNARPSDDMIHYMHSKYAEWNIRAL
jgi:hypothetical protein